jgi:hypothetical protein
MRHPAIDGKPRLAEAAGGGKVPAFIMGGATCAF